MLLERLRAREKEAHVGATHRDERHVSLWLRIGEHLNESAYPAHGDDFIPGATEHEGRYRWIELHRDARDERQRVRARR